MKVAECRIRFGLLDAKNLTLKEDWKVMYVLFARLMEFVATVALARRCYRTEYHDLLPFHEKMLKILQDMGNHVNRIMIGRRYTEQGRLVEKDNVYIIDSFCCRSIGVRRFRIRDGSR